MFLDKNKCAQCGRQLSDSAKYASHNHQLSELSVLFSGQPLFCKQECIDDVLAAHLESTADIEKHWKDRKALELEAIKGRLDAEVKKVREEIEDDLAKPGKDAASVKRVGADKLAKLKERAETNAKQLSGEVQQWLDYSLREREKTKPEKSIAILHAFFAEYQVAKQREEADRSTAVSITDQHKFEHTHILGPSGSGKTTLIQNLILKDITDDTPAMVVIDPKGFMVEQISRLKSISQDRIIYIDPLATPPLNLFKQGNRAFVTQAINNFDYIFAQAGSPLTSKMRPVFKFCARLIFTIPGADIFLLMDFLESNPGDPRFTPYIDRLDDLGAKRFFQKDFYSPKLYGETRQQIKGRFNDILSMPEVLSMFTAPQSLDFTACLNEKKIILVNTRAAEIGVDASQLVGRYTIALTLSAAFARGRNANPVWLYVDEFQDFVDEEATPRHFRLAREYRLGIIAAHQNMFCNELTETLRTAISGNTAIKYCAKVSGADRAYMLRDLGCDDGFLDQQVSDKTRQLVRFACAVRGHQPFSVSIKYPSITPDMLGDAPEPIRASVLAETHKPLSEESGLRGVANMPVGSGKSILPPKDDNSDAAAEWDV